MEELKPSYKLEIFEGPLDLLLSLIVKNEIDIYDIPIAIIFEQYMDYLRRMQTLDMDIASEFIVMASELMLIKSRMLLPKEVVDGEEIDPREELVRSLLEYQRAKEEAKFLAERFATYFGRFVKETDEIGMDRTFVAEQESDFLIEALKRLVQRISLEERMHNEEAEKTLTHIITQRPASVSGRTRVILTKLSNRKQARFLDVMADCRTRSEIVASFMAILALIAAQKIVAQPNENDPADPIIELVEGALDSGVDTDYDAVFEELNEQE